MNTDELKIVGFAVLLAGGSMAQVEHQHHPPGSAHEYAQVLEDPGRDAWQKPHEVVMALKLRPDEVIADIGAGTGYFSRRFARHAGKVYAVDIDAKLLEIAAKDAPPNLSTILAAPDDPKLPDANVDTIFFCDVLHHIGVEGHGPGAEQTDSSRQARSAYYGKLAKALKPGGRIVIVDFYKKQLPVGPAPAMKLSEEQVTEELSAAGFRAVRRHEGLLPHQWFVEYEK